MTSSRESMRRELRELAKLADTMRKDQAADMRSSGEWSPLELAPESLAPPAPLPPPPLPPPSNTTVPPSVSSYAPVFGTPEVASESPKPRRGATIAMIAGVAVLGALVATGTVGRSLWKAPAASAQTAAAGALIPAPPSPMPAADPPPAPEPAATPPATNDTGMKIAATPGNPSMNGGSNAPPTSTNAGGSAPAARHHSPWGAGAKAQAAKATSIAVSTGPKKAAAVAAPPPSDSLTDMMRKAVATPAP